MRTLRSAGLLLCLGLTVFGCTKKGDTGPTGPPGSANVMYSAWVSVASWTGPTVVAGVHEESYSMAATALTQAILDNGVVLVYMKTNSLPSEVVQLPINWPINGFTFMFRSTVGNIKVVYHNTTSPGTDPGVYIADWVSLRYVLIPGSVLTSSLQPAGDASVSLADRLKAMPYSEVCALYGIPE